MFLSKSEEEIGSNKKLAEYLIEKLGRIIFNKSTRFNDLRNTHDIHIPMIKKSRASRPEPSPSVYLVNPKSNFNPKIAKANRRQQVLGDTRESIAKRLKQLKASKKKPLQAKKPSAEGRRMLLSV
ncbi:hypothetical protein REPUB_Repub13aG0277100 [Reevesia pubescens]